MARIDWKTRTPPVQILSGNGAPVREQRALRLPSWVLERRAPRRTRDRPLRASTGPNVIFPEWPARFNPAARALFVNSAQDRRRQTLG